MTEEIEVKEPKMTLKQRAFLKEYFASGNGVKSAMKVYDTDDYSTAGAIASQNLKLLKNPIKEYMEQNGFSLKHLLAVLAGGLNAKKIHGSMTSPDTEVDDWPTRHKYLETAARWLGVETKDESQSQTPQTQGIKRQITATEFFEESK